MTLTRDDLLGLSQYAFGRLRDRMDGLDDAEYLWSPFPGGRRIHPTGDGGYRSDGRAAPGEVDGFSTLAWRLCHVISVLQEERNGPWLGLAPRGLGWPADGTGAVGSAGEVRAALDQAGAVWHDLLAATTDARLAEPIGAVGGPYGEGSRASFALHVIDELIHHGAEAALMRDLYAAWPHPR